jgi:hypothetical protein
MVMDFYIMISLATVFGLLAWWLYLAFSGLKDESSIQRAEDVTRQKPLGLENSLISIFPSCHSDNSAEQSHSVEPGR